MLPQPPPNAPAPLPSEAALRSRTKWRWLLAVGLFSMLVVFTAPMTIRSRKKADQTEAVNNARQIGLALFEFEQEYGKFPDATTIAAVTKDSRTTLRLGEISSNDFFRQLLVAAIAQSEGMFYAKTQDSRRPDGVATGKHAIAKRECGFTYFLGATAKDNPNRPIVVTPMIPGTDRFDPKPHKGKAVILKLDNSVTSYNIDEHGHIIIDGRNLMDPHHPIWQGHAPTIAWPQL